ncbi:hypothetical protein IAT38_003877 [Cryptococcus sp. DSM 104549]
MFSLLSPSLDTTLAFLILASFTTARPTPYEIVPRDDDESYREKAQNWCNSNPSGCKGVAAVGGVTGLALILYLIIHCYRKKRRNREAAQNALQAQEQKAAEEEVEKKVEEKFFHRQRELKLKHDMEMLGLTPNK